MAGKKSAGKHEYDQKEHVGQCLLEAVAQLQDVIDTLNLGEVSPGGNFASDIFEARDNLNDLADDVNLGAYDQYFHKATASK